MVHEAVAEAGGNRLGVVPRVARQLGVGAESLRAWVKHDEIEAGMRPGIPRAESERVAALEREVREPTRS